jgi:hypothetical protein
MLSALILPLLVAVPVAVLLWTRRQVTVGTVAGAGILLFGALVFGGVEYVDNVRFRLNCELRGALCGPSHPSDFVKISIFGVIAMMQVMALFVVSMIVERRMTAATTTPSGADLRPPHPLFSSPLLKTTPGVIS